MTFIRNALVFLLILTTAGCATVGPSLETQDDFRTMTSDVVLQLIRPDNRQQVYDSEDFHDYWEKWCFESNSECSGVDRGQYGDDQIGHQYWPMLMKQLIIGCANEGDTANTNLDQNTFAFASSRGYCSYLATEFMKVGNKDAARAILLHAPGCKGIDDAGDHIFKCNGYQGYRDASGFHPFQLFSDNELTALAQDALSYDPSDQWAANVLIEHGIHIDINAVEELHRENVAAAKEAMHDRSNRIAEQDEEHQARVDAVLGALRDAGGGNPTAIIDAGNQQAATIRAMAAADSAHVAVVPQPRLAAQQQVALASVTSTATDENVAASNTAPMSNSAVTSTPAPNFLSPLSASCIRAYPDPQYYNWLSFQNICGQAIYVSYIYRQPTGWAMGGGMTLAPGAHENTGNSALEVNNADGMLLYVCPANSVPVDLNGNTFNTNVSQYQCRPT
jgi:hypothetical protein